WWGDRFGCIPILHLHYEYFPGRQDAGDTGRQDACATDRQDAGAIRNRSIYKNGMLPTQTGSEDFRSEDIPAQKTFRLK
ncbi:hypothetical protein C7B61_21335, partial [filamentous cyanobacterium CCP1]